MILTESRFKFQKVYTFRLFQIWGIFTNIENSSILTLSTTKQCFQIPPCRGGGRIPLAKRQGPILKETKSPPPAKTRLKHCKKKHNSQWSNFRRKGGWSRGKRVFCHRFGGGGGTRMYFSLVYCSCWFLLSVHPRSKQRCYALFHSTIQHTSQERCRKFPLSQLRSSGHDYI